ncbi:MAG: HAD-IA family hydrolase [Gemmataceae bacterium]|nr:HAD-IA family hydrolase [Gemmataceae bacterium]
MKPADTEATVRAVLFDFDGTLADSYPGITASVNHVRASYGLPPLSEAAVRPHVGRGPRDLLAHTVPGSDPVRDVEVYRAHYVTAMNAGTHLMPGAAESLAALKTAGLLLGVCSNKPRRFTIKLVEHLGMQSRFDVVVGPEEVPRPKPAPDMLTLALRQLSVAAEDALYVGDMTVDVETARGAGVRVWVVPTGSNDRSTLEAAQPDRLLNSLQELPALLTRRAFP